MPPDLLRHPVTYPPDLPITGRLPEIEAALHAHQVIVVAGETGSGKSTQLPKLCLAMGRGSSGRIAHTQPRRLAARSIAARVAEELGEQVGGLVGSRIRFSDTTSPKTRLVVMTDGILLAEIASDRLLRRYDTIIVDEAHERSLTIDFLLGYLTRVLPQRPDLRVIITSATIEPARFAAHFEDATRQPVPVVEVSGRTYPVEVRYRPFGAGHDDAGAERDQTQAVRDAVDELRREIPGDMLVFLSGEREIRDTAEALRAHLGESAEVLPLYGRLSVADQQRVFAPAPLPRVVLATNVAETSITVPGIRYVVDAGTARVSRYSTRSKVQRLPVEPVSKASASQRAGRCGRVAAGVCVRLYSEENFEARPDYSDPEVLRTSLAAVLLRMAALELGDIDSFGFLDPPDSRSVRDGLRTLDELGALRLPRGKRSTTDVPGTPDGPSLTRVGRAMARLPLDPRLARMVVQAEEKGCVQEVLVIVGALSIQDPRERPLDFAAQADEAHRRFQDDSSDLLGYLNLWAYLQEQQRRRSGSAFRRMCRAEFLHYLRIREWQDLVTTLRHACRDIGIDVPARPDLRPDSPTRAHPDAVHQAVLAGLLSHIGMWDAQRREYRGARETRFVLGRESALARRPPRWLVAASLLDTSRVIGRDAARIDPGWVEPLARHLVSRSLSEPRWDPRRGAAMAMEKVLLFGLPIVAGRGVPVARADAALARELLVREGLVAGDIHTTVPFLKVNARTLEQVRADEARVRQRLALDDDELSDLYEQLLPESVVSVRHLERWWREASAAERDRFFFTPEQLRRPDRAASDTDQFPTHWAKDGFRLDVEYRLEPGEELDGATLVVPVDLLNRLQPATVSWPIPGYRHDAVVGLIRSLPKAVRRSFVPAADYAAEVSDRIIAAESSGEPFEDAVAAALTSFGGPRVSASDFDVGGVPSHARLHVRVVDDQGRTLRSGELDELQRELAVHARQAVAAVVTDRAGTLEMKDLRTWPDRDIPRSVEVGTGAGTVTGFPALVAVRETESQTRVDLQVLGDEAAQAASMPLGTRALLLRDLAPTPRVTRQALTRPGGRMGGQAALALAASPYADLDALVQDCLACAVDHLVSLHGGPAWTREQYGRLRAFVGDRLGQTSAEVATVAVDVLAASARVHSEIDTMRSDAVAASREDLEVQLDGLVFDGFIAATGREQLGELPRYLRAMQVRVQRLQSGGALAQDGGHMATIHGLEDAYHAVVDALGGSGGARGSAAAVPADVAAVRWMLEECRVSLFAQHVGTRGRASPARVRRALNELDGPAR